MHEDFLIILNNVRMTPVEERKERRVVTFFGAAVVIWWPRDPNVISIMFEVLYIW
jgi:hypothetical protein